MSNFRPKLALLWKSHAVTDGLRFFWKGQAMASALYLENFLESKPVLVFSVVSITSLSLSPSLVSFRRPDIENLPTELQRNFTLMRSLDQRAQGTGQVLTYVQCALRCVTLQSSSTRGGIAQPWNAECDADIYSYSTLCRVRWRIFLVLLDQEAWAARVDLLSAVYNA